MFVDPNSILEFSMTLGVSCGSKPRRFVPVMWMDLGAEEELLFPEIAKRKAEGPMSKL